MKKIHVVEFYSLITPMRLMHVRPDDHFIAEFCDKVMGVYVTGTGIDKILIPMNNVKFMTFKKELVHDTPTKTRQKTTTTRVSKTTRSKDRLAKGQLQRAD